MTEHKTLTEALAAFQASLPNVAKSSTNPHFNSKFAALEDISAVVLPKLAEHGMAWVTRPTFTDEGLVLAYELRHVSGESISGVYPLGAASAGPQQMGTNITYARRYVLLAVTGVAPGGEDDDGNSAQAAHKQPPAVPADFISLVDAATTIRELTALANQASAGGFFPQIKGALTARKKEIYASANTATPE